MIKHFDIAKDIYVAFQRLVVEHEAPAIIIVALFMTSLINL